jgi:hypothetical protein
LNFQDYCDNELPPIERIMSEINEDFVLAILEGGELVGKDD